MDLLPIDGRKLSSLGPLLKCPSGIARKGLSQSARKSRNLSQSLAPQAEIGSYFLSLLVEILVSTRRDAGINT